MSAARDVIARALVQIHSGFIAEHGLAGRMISLGNFAYADGVLAALRAAGYRIVGPGEVDDARLAEILRVFGAGCSMAGSNSLNPTSNPADCDECVAGAVAALHRALGGKDA